MVPIRYFVVKCRSKWRVEFDNKYENGFPQKMEAVKHAVDKAREKAKESVPSEVLVQDIDNIWYTVWTSQTDE